jgi:hypothetical protein
LRYPLTNRLSLIGSAGVSRARFDADGEMGMATGMFPPTGPPFVRPPVFPGPIIGLFPVTPVAVADPDDETGGYFRAGLSWRFGNALAAGLTLGKQDVKVLEVEALSLSLSYAF